MKFVDNLVKQEEEKDTVDSLIRQAIGKEPFLSFSRAADGPFQLIQLLNSFDQQGSGKIFRSEENYIELKENSIDHTIGIDPILSKNGIMEPVNFLKGYGEFTKGSKNTTTIQPFKIPEGVVEFAQATAKASGDMKNTSKVSRPDICGWPLMSPSKRQLHKCDKCSREFCSSINYRRHIRVHRRSLNVHKDSPKNRHNLSEFWDKLSIDGAKELVSLKRATVEATGCEFHLQYNARLCKGRMGAKNFLRSRTIDLFQGSLQKKTSVELVQEERSGVLMHKLPWKKFIDTGTNVNAEAQLCDKR